MTFVDAALKPDAKMAAKTIRYHKIPRSAAKLSAKQKTELERREPFKKGTSLFREKANAVNTSTCKQRNSIR